MSNMGTSKEKIRHVLHFIFYGSENASQATENVNNIYGPDTATANHIQFRFRQIHSGSLDLKGAPRIMAFRKIGMPQIVENADKIMEIVKPKLQTSTDSFVQRPHIIQTNSLESSEKG
uniref:Mos1 transposase HTH domain-containing protein n=1 Tax=Ceratitis capitata TaxID=7213 RepID=W8C5H0_CERCA